MKKDIVLGGYLIAADGFRHQLPVAFNPNDSTIEDIVKTVSSADKGVVVLRCEPTPAVGPEKLELYVDAGNLLLMLGVNEEDGDYRVRTLTNENIPNDLLVILGEKYPAKAVTRDIGFVYTVFNEFLHTGDVSTALMR
jgi:hypothetical protein